MTVRGLARPLRYGSLRITTKEGENVWDVITLVSRGLWLCYSVLRTGTLWLAVGYHVSFDYMQLFVIGTKNGSVEPAN
jgi:uncharacterized protein